MKKSPILPQDSHFAWLMSIPANALEYLSCTVAEFTSEMPLPSVKSLKMQCGYSII